MSNHLVPVNVSEFGPIRLLVVQSTTFCNLDCDYCYLPNRTLKHRLSLDLIEPILKAVFTSPFFRQDVTLCWHAGEPLAVPISFYDAVGDRLAEANKQYNNTTYQIHQSVQTNGTLINQAWCDCFKRHNIHVGVSIDGPAFLHDAHRKTLGGSGSHGYTMRGISYLQQNDIPFTVIAVITEDSLNYPDELFNFFQDNGITDVGFNMEETEGVNECSSLSKKDILVKYQAFIRRIWELVSQTKGELRIREFEGICSLIYQEQRLPYTEMNHPFSIVSVDYQGNFATFDPELLSVKTPPYGDFVLGNVVQDSLESVCYTEKFQQLYAHIQQGVDMCRDSCSYFGVCGGGAPSNKYWENGTFACAETQACEYRTKVITDVVVEELESVMV